MQWALRKLLWRLDGQVPADLVMLPEVEVVLFEQWPSTVRIPDLVMVSLTSAEANPPRYRADDVRLAVAITAPGSVGTDQTTKFGEYAKAGIPNYWIVDLEKPASVAAYSLKDGHGVLVAESAMELTVPSPGVMTFDPAQLVPPRATR